MPSLADLLRFLRPPFAPSSADSPWADPALLDEALTDTSTPPAPQVQDPSTPWRIGQISSDLGSTSPLNVSEDQSVAPSPVASDTGILGPIMATGVEGTPRFRGILSGVFGGPAASPWAISPPPVPAASPFLTGGPNRGAADGLSANVPLQEPGDSGRNPVWPAASQSFFQRDLNTQSDNTPPEYGDPQSQNDGFHVYAQIYHPERSAGSSSDGMQGQLLAPWQRGDQGDWPPDLQLVQAGEQSGLTGDPRVDRATEFLLDALRESAAEVGKNVRPGMRATVFGTLVHVNFGRRVRALDLPGIGQDGVEHSLSTLEEIARYGLAGTIRTDVLLRDQFGRPLAIYDLKTGNAQLTPRRMKELRDAAKAPDIPIIELRYREETAIRR